MDLVPWIFHEHQELGSQLCAQHCLNNLLQQPVYTEVDLADLARKLDEAEAASAYAAPPTKSYNYDDTGFFSISVLEKAMQVWDLTLVRWRGEAMKPYVDHPEEQSGFILNLASHWFALRRFGDDSTRWYNLNSFLTVPEWISSTYLQMVLAQAETEGYSVFVVRKAGEGAGETAANDPGEGAGWGDGGVANMPHCGADEAALGMGPVKDRRGSGGSWSRPSESIKAGSEADAGPSGTSGDLAESEPSTAGSRRRRRRQEDLTSEFVEDQDVIGSHPSSRSRTPRSRGSGRHHARDVFEDDSAMLNELDHHEVLDDDEELDHDEGYVPPAGRYSAMGMGMDAYGGPTDFAFQRRSYDDEDAALQAALKASMEGLPDDFVMPELKPVAPEPFMNAPQTQPAAEAEPAPQPQAQAPAETEAQKDADEHLDFDEDDDDAPAKALSPAEIRAARLARFQ